MNTKQPVLSDLFSNYSEAKGWAGRFKPSADEIDAFRIEFCGMQLAGSRFLEIGFGPGSLLAWAISKGARVSGVEIDPASVTAAREFGIDLLPHNFQNIASEYENEFDIIAAFDVFEHFTLDDISSRLGAIETMLKTGGLLILRFPNSQSPFGQSPQHGDATHLTSLSAGKFKQLIHGSSLSIIRYNSAARPRGRTPLLWFARSIRYLGQDLVEAVLSGLYPPRVPLSPVVTLVLRRA